MILGIGTDLVDINRIAGTLKTHGQRFKTRCFTAYEQKAGGDNAAFFAKRFAAKEACAKALGCGFVDGMSMADIGVESNSHGGPFFVLSGKALQRLEDMGGRAHLSLSDEPPYAQAFVVIEKAL